MSLKLVIADDEPMARERLRMLLADESGVEVVAEAGDGQQVLDACAAHRPHAVLLDGLGQWVFSRGEVAPGEHYVQVVVSAAHALRGLGREAITGRVLEELARLFPAVGAATLLRTRVVTEHAATFRPAPGVDRHRPPQATPVPNLVLAGDWTQTGWPATMEGAVRSGFLAAEEVRKRQKV